MYVDVEYTKCNLCIRYFPWHTQYPQNLLCNTQNTQNGGALHKMFKAPKIGGELAPLAMAMQPRVKTVSVMFPLIFF